jgi:hypothetical protein
VHKRASHDDIKIQRRGRVPCLPHIRHNKEVFDVGVENLIMIMRKNDNFVWPTLKCGLTLSNTAFATSEEPLGDGVRSASRTTLNACASFRSASISSAVVWFSNGVEVVKEENGHTVLALLLSFVEFSSCIFILTEQLTISGRVSK